MMGVAAGLSTMGYVPFVSSFAMFAAGRAFEQVRNSIGYPHLNAKIGATHGGISVGEDGASHQCCEDFALMRSSPGMTVICPADDVEARAAVRAAYAMEGPVYLRFGRLAVPVFHDAENYHFEIGKGEQITEGSDIAIIATGLMVNEARMAAEQLAAEGIHARVINIHTIKPLDEEIVLKAAKECGKVITAEEHNVIGGLGEAVCAVLSENLQDCPLPTPVRLAEVTYTSPPTVLRLCKKLGFTGFDDFKQNFLCVNWNISTSNRARWISFPLLKTTAPCGWRRTSASCKEAVKDTIFTKTCTKRCSCSNITRKSTFFPPGRPSIRPNPSEKRCSRSASGWSFSTI